MTKQNKCRFCGVEAGKYAVSYPCGSWHTSDRQWSQGIACRDLSEQLRLQQQQTIEILRMRIDEAVEALAAIERHETGSDLGFQIISQHGEWVLWDDLDDVVKILRGNSPTIPESSEG